jgi:urease accessory protein
MATSTDDATLTLAQWFSPAYPVGAFHFSHGLEWAIQSGAARDPESLRDWIRTVLLHGTGHNDALFLAAAYDAWDEARLDEIDIVVGAFCASRERFIEARDTGAAFARITGRLMGWEIPPRTYPVAVGAAAAKAELPVEQTIQFYLQAFLTNLASVGMRLIPVGQSDGHEIIRDLNPLCIKLSRECADGDLDRLSATAFLADIASMRHETQYSRTFRT